MIDRIRFVLHETWESLLRNATMQAAAISTACIALILLGGAGMALYKLDAAASALPSQFEAEVFLKMSATREQALQLKAELESWQEVERVDADPARGRLGRAEAEARGGCEPCGHPEPAARQAHRARARPRTVACRCRAHPAVAAGG
jgi:hypothetical protein